MKKRLHRRKPVLNVAPRVVCDSYAAGRRRARYQLNRERILAHKRQKHQALRELRAQMQRKGWTLHGGLWVPATKGLMRPSFPAGR